MVLVKLLSRTSDKSAKAALKPTVSPDGRLAEPAPASVTDSSQPSADARPSVSIYSSDTRQEAPAVETPAVVTAELTIESAEVTQEANHELKPPPLRQRRFSWRGISLFNGNAQEEHKPALSADEEQRKKFSVAEDRTRHILKVYSADRKARESAIIVRSLIVGQHAITVAETNSKPVNKTKVSKVKAELMQPKKANKVIAHLRALPGSSDALPPSGKLDATHAPATTTHPIHAVCLPLTDAEANVRHFSKFSVDSTAQAPSQDTTEQALNVTVTLAQVSSVYNTGLEQVKSVLSEMHLVNLLAADMGIGQPGDGPGLLSGSVPTAKTILDGVKEVTPTLMSLGYATGKILLPDHSGIYPPTDRMSVLTYWWGFEIVMPPPSITYLSQAPSIVHSAINVLTALSVLDGGVREILPFVRYISSFIDTEFNIIKQEDQGKGVVCAATWLIPTALVPRPWDFPDAPVVKVDPAMPNSPAEPSKASPANPSNTERSSSDSSDSEPAVQQPPSGPLSPTSPTPSLPPLPSSPTLLPPLPSFDTDDAPSKAPPVDDAPVEGMHATQASGEEEVPAVAVVPPTPPASNTLKGAPEEISTAGDVQAQTTWAS
ncbi:hypothetical protein EIP86_004957 [Pleurotus ostreatoroseus]|nr:hypothetical protein EIP86_004957 [Pleurotus ostreatoroseus]